MRRILFTETNLNELPTPPSGYRYIGFDGATFSIQTEVGTEPVDPGTGGVGVTDVTYSELVSLKDSDSLTPGSFYKITDFRTCYDQPDFDINGNGITSSNTYKTSEIEPIMVFATSESTLDSSAFQSLYPNDKIKYDITWNQTEKTGGTAYGRITERIDEYNNRTDYDHRNVRFKRYRSRFLDGTVGGRIISMNEGVVVGTGSNFVTDFATGSVVFLESLNPKFYKVTDIISATQMTVEGVNYDNFSDPIGYRLQQTYLEQSFTPGGLYYFNDSGTNGIEDGGNDMYDGANYLNTNLQNQIPYTHTQMVGIEGQALLEDFTYDGTVEVGDSYFGEGSSYFTNTYPGLFVMAAYDVSVTDFSITGNIGADGGGDVEVAEYTWEGFKIFVKKVFNAGDPSINHIIIVNSTDELIERTYDPNGDDDDHELTNLDNVTQIHYLLFGLASGIKPTELQIENVYQTYLNMIDNMSISNTLTTLNANFTDITENLPPNDTIYSSLRVRQSNIAEDNSVYREILTFDTGITARNNYIGNACDSWEWDERDFMLPNNVFTNAYGNNIDIYDNYFGDRCVDNTFGDDVYENVVGADFRRNMCEDRFDRNQIASNFYNNEFYATEFESNVVGDNFNNNIIIQDYNDVYDNNIGNDFADNRFFSESRFYRNRVGVSFNSNRIHDDVYNNDIGNGFTNNDIYRQFHANRIGNNFGSNDFYNNFFSNQVDNDFDSNTIGLSSNIGAGLQFLENKIGVDVKGNLFTGETMNNIIGDNFYANETGNYFNRNVFGIECIENTIGENFEDNNIGNYFSSNVIANYFTNNNILNNFAFNNILNNFTFNNIGNYFRENNIENDFGFGGGQAYGNRIGNYFQFNEIGEYFYNNDIRDVFDNNIVGHYFRDNTIQVQNLSGYNFNTNYGNIITFTDNTGASPSVPGTDGTYNALTAYTEEGDHGYDANFNVVVSGSVVTSVSLNASGFEYSPSDTLTILGTDFGGTTESNITITVGSVSTTPSVYANYNTTIFKNSLGNYRLSYYDDNDVLTITNLDV